MKKVLFAWLDKLNYDAVLDLPEANQPGSILTSVTQGIFDKVVILSGWNKEKTSAFSKALREKLKFSTAREEVIYDELVNPSDLTAIYEKALNAVSKSIKSDPDKEFYFLFSAGNQYMTAVWILLIATKFRKARLLQSSRDHGIAEINFPFDISAEYLPGIVMNGMGGKIEASEFKDIIFRSPEMAAIVRKAKLFAGYDVPVLLQGESGVGKELFAQAIHRSSSRRDGPLITVNCAAIPSNLLESELFGYEKGAFSGAFTLKKGKFELADGGTLFLDEIGELSFDLQAKLLRALADEKEVCRLGGKKPIKIDVRIIAATNIDIINAIKKGAFRDDLYYRLNIADIKIPPLRQRVGDQGLLVDHFMSILSSRIRDGIQLSPAAKNILTEYSWPGNVREMVAVLTRAIILAPTERIASEDIRPCLFETHDSETGVFEQQPIGENFSLEKTLGKMAESYFDEAFRQSGGNKTKAAKLLGYSMRQTLDSKLQKFKLSQKYKWDKSQKTTTIKQS